MPNAKLILYPDANHGSWYQHHEDFVFETNRFLGGGAKRAHANSELTEGRMLPRWLRLSHLTARGALQLPTFPWTEDQNYESDETGEE